MFGATILTAYFFMPPLELKDLGQSLLASSAFYSNFYFSRQSGYFAPTSEYAPLLHTWTLSVEEQFYVCWPLFLGFLANIAKSKWKVPATVFVLLGALMLSAHWVDSGHRVILVAEVPLPVAVNCIIWARFNHRDESVCEKAQVKELSETEALVDEELRNAAVKLQPQVQIVYPYDYLCVNQKCMVQDNGRMLYLDESHLSYNGIRLIESSLEKSAASALFATNKPSGH